MAATFDNLAARGIGPVAPGPEGEDGFRSAFVADPDGYQIELVQWPEGHPEGMTAQHPGLGGLRARPLPRRGSDGHRVEAVQPR